MDEKLRLESGLRTLVVPTSLVNSFIHIYIYLYVL